MDRRNFLLATGGAFAAAALVAADRTDAATAVAKRSSNHADASVEPWMQGSPPPAERIIRFEDGSCLQWPQIRWTMCHFDELAPTRTILPVSAR